MSAGPSSEPLLVYSRQGCHLCEVLLEELLPLVRDRVAVTVLDIDTREDWRSAYNDRVPVVEYRDEFVCQYQLDRAALARALGDDFAS